MKLIFLMFLFFLTTNTFSQSSKVNTYHVGNGSNSIVPSEKRCLQYVENKDGLINFQSILTRKVEKVLYNEQPQILITQTYQSDKFIDRDSCYCNAKTLIPLAHYSDIPSEGHKERVTFSENGIVNTIKMLIPGLSFFEYTTEVEVLGKEFVEIPGIGQIACRKIRTSSRAGSSSLEWYSVKEQVQVKKKFEFKNGKVFYRVLLAGI